MTGVRGIEAFAIRFSSAELPFFTAFLHCSHGKWQSFNRSRRRDFQLEMQKQAVKYINSTRRSLSQAVEGGVENEGEWEIAAHCELNLFFADYRPEQEERRRYRLVSGEVFCSPMSIDAHFVIIFLFSALVRCSRRGAGKGYWKRKWNKFYFPFFFCCFCCIAKVFCIKSWNWK